MELVRLKWGEGCAILLLILTATGDVSAIRPETVLENVLVKPFVPRGWASPECLRDAGIYLKALETYTPWALQMYDASVKIPSGLITGNHKQLGNFDECVRVRSDHGFIGQACHASVYFEIAADNGAPREPDMGDLLVNVAIASNATKWRSGNTIAYEWMWCLPSTCNHSEVKDALEIALDPLKVEQRVDVIVNLPKGSCYTAETVRVVWNIADYCYISILVLFALIIVASTGYDVAIQRGLITSNREVILTSFSMYTNGKNLLRTDRQPESIGCLDGLRYLSICWIIYGHTHYMEAVGVKMNLAQIPHMHHDWSNMLVLNGNIVTDTFFLLSGILLAYTKLSKKKRNIKWFSDIIGLYIHRYLRVTPAYAMMIGFYATLFYKFGMGPQWDIYVASNRDFCRENWWTNLLYINNYVNVPSMCMSQSWYLSVDMQLVWLSPLILYPMLKLRSLLFAIIFVIGLLLSILAPLVVTYIHGLTGTMLYYKNLSDVAQVYLQIYTRVYNRFGPYLIGLGLGYLLHKTRSCNVKLRAWHVICGWLVAIVAGLCVVFGPRGMYFDTYVYNKLVASLYAGMHRQVFTLSISWIIFCCVHGYAGPVNHFLSWRGWMPLSRLTYCAYLSHYLFVLSNIGSVRTADNLTTMNVVRTFFANLMFTMLLSALWSLCFEMPFTVIDRALLSRREQKLPKRTYYGSMESEKEINRTRDDSSTTYDHDKSIKFNIRHHDSAEDTRILKENRAKGAADEETERSPGKIYVINPTTSRDVTVDRTWSDVNPADNRKTTYVDVNFYRAFDEDGQSCSKGAGSIEPIENPKPSRSLRDRGQYIV